MESLWIFDESTVIGRLAPMFVTWQLMSSGLVFLSIVWGHWPHPISGFENHLRECVVEGQCPAGESKAHVLMERIGWWFISHFSRVGTIVFIFLLVIFAWVYLAGEVAAAIQRTLRISLKSSTE